MPSMIRSIAPSTAAITLLLALVWAAPLHATSPASRPPEPISRVEPIYPEVARKAGIHGNVVIRCSIDEQGQVRATEVIKSMPFGLDMAAAAAVKQWKFRPAEQDGKAIPSSYEAVVTFKSTAEPQRDGTPASPAAAASASSKAKFLMHRCTKDSYNPGAFIRWVVGVVPPEVNLRDDHVVNSLLADGAALAMSDCPSSRIPFGQITVILRAAGNADTFSPNDIKPLFDWAFHTLGTPSVPSDAVYASSKFGWDKDTGLTSKVEWQTIANGPKRATEARLAAQTAERKRQAQRETNERAQEAEVAPVRALIAKHKVSLITDVIELTANPFVHKGKVVAVTAAFDRMVSETTAVFDYRGKQIVVSGVPGARFTAQDKKYSSFLVGKVLGTSELKTQFGGTELCPHISYLGSHVCRGACYDKIVNPH